jgi:hypothetical protein
MGGRRQHYLCRMGITRQIPCVSGKEKAEGKQQRRSQENKEK